MVSSDFPCFFHPFNNGSSCPTKKEKTRQDKNAREERDDGTQDKRREKTGREMKKDKRRDKMKKREREDERTKKRHDEKRRKTNYSSFSSKVQNLTVFSIIFMIRIRFFGPGELIQDEFRAARYLTSILDSHLPAHILKTFSSSSVGPFSSPIDWYCA